MYRSIIVIGGLLSAVFAQSEGNCGACIGGSRYQVARFDTFRASKGLAKQPVPDGYLGFEWQDFDIIPVPVQDDSVILNFIGASSPNVIQGSNQNGGGAFRIKDQSHTFRIRSFDAGCYAPSSKYKIVGVNCTVGLVSDPTTGNHRNTFQYSSPAVQPYVNTFSPAIPYSASSYNFSVTTPNSGKVPMLLIDNIVIERFCQS